MPGTIPTTMPAPLSVFHYDGIVKTALREDMPYAGDMTSALNPAQSGTMTAELRARDDGVVAGIDVALHAFHVCDPGITITKHKNDGDTVAKNDIIVTVLGTAYTILQAERTALNILSHMSGIASLTRRYCDRIQHTKARIAGTRKTLPGLRVLQKYAVQCGGGLPHRYGLNDAIMIKDSHIAVAGDIRTALDMAYKNKPHMVGIIVEVDTLDQLHMVADAPGADVILLDNMDCETLKQAVAIVDGRAVTEASGGVTIDTVAGIAETGVDIISIGALTHSAPVFDIGLDTV